MRRKTIVAWGVALVAFAAPNPLDAQYVRRGTWACIGREEFERYGRRILMGDSVDLPLLARASCVRLPRSYPVEVAERTRDGLGVRIIEDGAKGRSLTWISTSSLVPGALPDSERTAWPVITSGPRVAKGTVTCSTEEGIRQAANLIARGDTADLGRRTPFHCFHIARDDSVLEVVVRSGGMIAYKGYPRGRAGVAWVREADVLGLESISVQVESSDSLTLVSFTVTPLRKDPSLRVYRSSASITLTVRNNTRLPVAAWRAILVVMDPFGDELFRTQVTDGRANIGPAMIGDASFEYEDNEFIANEPYDKLIAYDASKLVLRLTDIRLVR